MSKSAMPSQPDAKSFPTPDKGLLVTHVLIVADQDRSREFYRHILGAEVMRERDPVALRLGNGWIVLDVGGGPTDDRPDVSTYVIGFAEEDAGPRSVAIWFHRFH